MYQMYMDEPIASITAKIVFVSFFMMAHGYCDEPSQMAKVHSGSFGSLRMEIFYG